MALAARTGPHTQSYSDLDVPDPWENTRSLNDCMDDDAGGSSAAMAE